jgi:hypothetical protein
MISFLKYVITKSGFISTKERSRKTNPNEVFLGFIFKGIFYSVFSPTCRDLAVPHRVLLFWGVA